ncbi:MAG: hypothetical protein HY710_11510 [Candidatus Latescibacteria bacterium]|nr:hypothetical protein [Candidatus Latescibacterota bacterium]
MERHERLTQAVYNAIDEVNERLEPDEALDRSPDTVLIGEHGTLDSAGFVTFIAAVEEQVERTFRITINVIDVVTAGEPGQWTVAMLTARLADLVDGAEPR